MRTLFVGGVCLLIFCLTAAEEVPAKTLTMVLSRPYNLYSSEFPVAIEGEA